MMETPPSGRAMLWHPRNMLVEHRGGRPSVHASAWIAPTAVLCGDVRVGADARVLWGAVVSAEDGSVELGERCVVMEQALVRGRAAHPVTVGADVLIGPHAHVNGARIGEQAFVATGAALFPGARVGARAEIRVHGVVHVNSSLPDGGLVPIGWVAVGDPAEVLPPDRHDEIWTIQRELDFPGTVYGEPRGDDLMARVMPRQAAWLGAHRDDRPL
jgi:carbonic anhydrase/acetyltransferase-like protein (isoleucine patch superfamily)